MRVLVVATTPEWTPGTRLIGSVAAGLAARGDVVALACASRSATERAVEHAWPRLSVRSVTGSGWFGQAMSVRGIVTALRPDALLVGSEADAVLAALAMGKRGGIVRRFAVDEREGLTSARDETLPWRARFALSRAVITPWGQRTLAVGWPQHTTPTTDDAREEVPRLPVVSPHIVLVPAMEHDEITAAALRAVAHLRTRHPDLRLSLVGDSAAMQATRLHAAALDLSAIVQVVPADALLHHELNDTSHVTSMAWVAAGGDAGALSTLAAMQQSLPVVVPQQAPFAELVVPGVTGFHVGTDNGVAVVSDLARLLSDADTQHRMGRAASARAARAFGWDAFVDHAADLLARAGGVARTRITRRPSLTPA
ncbi:glycosyltransferase [Gemmatimonas sp.]|uniref:glycosyltransferase n=1 Tax=Gemmatimonas sp. TaxID=1962908 RepID=UPI0031BC81DD|nr:glycosyltransferase family 4 protein [Gemmatimonas sp.]